MKNFLLSLCLICASLPAFATPGAPLIGKWINQGEQGGMVVEFTPNAMILTPVDTTGKPVDESQSVNVTYRGNGTVIDIILDGGDGTFRATMQDSDIMVLSMPGLPPTQYKRMK